MPTPPTNDRLQELPAGAADKLEAIYNVLAHERRYREAQITEKKVAFPNWNNVALRWYNRGFDADQVRGWLKAGCFHAEAAAQLRDAGVKPVQAAVVTDAGRGGPDKLGYKFFKGRIGFQKAVEIGLAAPVPQVEPTQPVRTIWRAENRARIEAAGPLVEFETKCSLLDERRQECEMTFLGKLAGELPVWWGAGGVIATGENGWYKDMDAFLSGLDDFYREAGERFAARVQHKAIVKMSNRVVPGAGTLAGWQRLDPDLARGLDAVDDRRPVIISDVAFRLFNDRNRTSEAGAIIARLETAGLIEKGMEGQSETWTLAERARWRKGDRVPSQEAVEQEKNCFGGNLNAPAYLPAADEPGQGNTLS